MSKVTAYFLLLDTEFIFGTAFCLLTTNLLVYYFFSGIFASTSSKCRQNLSTVGISILSSGECTPISVGPKEIISSVGYLSRNNPHSNPA